MGQGLKPTRGSWMDHLGSISGVLDLFGGLWRGPKPTVLHGAFKRGALWAMFLTFPGPPCQPGQFFGLKRLVQMSHIYTTCFMLNMHLWGVF